MSRKPMELFKVLESPYVGLAVDDGNNQGLERDTSIHCLSLLQNLPSSRIGIAYMRCSSHESMVLNHMPITQMLRKITTSCLNYYSQICRIKNINESNHIIGTPSSPLNTVQIEEKGQGVLKTTQVLLTYMSICIIKITKFERKITWNPYIFPEKDANELLVELQEDLPIFNSPKFFNLLIKYSSIGTFHMTLNSALDLDLCEEIAWKVKRGR